ncbi:MAG: trypsin-like peptidase domain-containing protein [Pirellulales bacterium]|nr:trypsin-like peptidase domain-containing protein [Pirellulales bacterium]
MKGYVLGCAVSAFCGAIAALWLTQGGVVTPLGAQVVSQNGALLPTSTPVAASPTVRSLSTVDDDLTHEERVNVAVYESMNMSVVNISTRTSRPDTFFPVDLESEGSGSGSVIDLRGHILTNSHVVAEAREISVTLHDGKSYQAKLVGTDPHSDIAVIRIEAPPESLHPVTFGDSSRLRVGQNVYAIGNPFGLDRTLTTGVISSLNRTLPVSRSRSLKSIIQIDAAINPGNSGGPLLDSRARLIGMNTAIASRTGQSSGVGFAIPVNSIARVVPQLIGQGRVVRPDIGIVAVYATRDGLRIAELTKGGPAERAGLRGPQLVRTKKGPFVFESLDRAAADVIVAVDGQKATAADDFLSLVENHKPGEQVVITVIREGRTIDVPVQLAQAE